MNASTSKYLSSLDEYRQLLDRYDTWLFDCDGVLWRGSTLVDGAKEFLQLLRSKNKNVIFVTNNASNSRATYKIKFDKLGIEAHVDEIFGSAYAAAVYLSSVVKLPKDKKVFVIGQTGLEEELRNEGVPFTGGTDTKDSTLEAFDPTSYEPDPTIGAVLCGFDGKINYTKLCKAFIHLNTNPSCLFLATNTDATYPDEGGRLCLGAGSISAPLRYALGREPLVLGKPSQIMMDCIKAKHKFDPKRTIMVGDRLNTDIQFGSEGGISTLLVLTGVTQVADLAPEAPPPAIPEYIANSIGDLIV
ncbi:2-phosphoglycolate phosphatase [Pyrrhoderma noxium]|uniref:4-nitrophenylphosphatase n=1 Tax=Pyrrhoderma noxium TaxID=2282107 RepID=A0A286UDU5_9AGAM|nr:2-phosphoglycolate phosphatase [Pyrrhoderma noxium]